MVACEIRVVHLSIWCDVRGRSWLSWWWCGLSAYNICRLEILVCFSPFLRSGETKPSFQSSGSALYWIKTWNIMDRASANSAGVSFINRAEMFSCPTVLWGLIFLNSFATPPTCTVISTMGEWGLGHKSGMCSVLSLVKTLGKLFVQYISFTSWITIPGHLLL